MYKEDESTPILTSVMICYNFLARKLLTLSTNGDKLDTLAGDEVQGFVDIGDLVEPHLTAVRLGQCLARDDLCTEQYINLDNYHESIKYKHQKGEKIDLSVIRERKLDKSYIKLHNAKTILYTIRPHSLEVSKFGRNHCEIKQQNPAYFVRC